MGCGGGVPSPLKKGSVEGAVPPPQKFLKIFFGSMCSKNFCVQAKGGGIAQWPPLNTPLAGCYTYGDSDVISVPAGVRRHLVGRTLRNVFTVISPKYALLVS